MARARSGKSDSNLCQSPLSCLQALVFELPFGMLEEETLPLGSWDVQRVQNVTNINSVEDVLEFRLAVLAFFDFLQACWKCRLWLMALSLQPLERDCDARQVGRRCTFESKTACSNFEAQAGGADGFVMHQHAPGGPPEIGRL